MLIRKSDLYCIRDKLFDGVLANKLIELSRGLPSIRAIFSKVNFHVELGTLLLCLLKEIGHNFPDGDVDAEKLIDHLCDIELSLISSGMLSPHFGTIIAHK